jgi:hypothetical protein
MADGVIYATAGTRRAVIAADAATGERRWIHGEPEGARGPPHRGSSRDGASRTGPTAGISESSM